MNDIYISSRASPLVIHLSEDHYEYDIILDEHCDVLGY